MPLQVDNRGARCRCRFLGVQLTWNTQKPMGVPCVSDVANIADVVPDVNVVADVGNVVADVKKWDPIRQRQPAA